VTQGAAWPPLFLPAARLICPAPRHKLDLLEFSACIMSRFSFLDFFNKEGRADSHYLFV
jgi:hypothetical protein